MERSDLLVQIVDSRNPLLFHCPDVDVYVKEVHPCKQTVLIVNKADLIPEFARVQWGRYFDSIHLPFVFFSAKASSHVIDQEMEKREKEEREREGKEEQGKEEQGKEEGETGETGEEEKKEEKEEEKKTVWQNRNAFAGLDFDDSSDEEEETETEEEEEEEKKEKAQDKEEEESAKEPIESIPSSSPQPSTEPSTEPSDEPSTEPSIVSDIRNYATDDILDPSVEPSDREASSLFSQEDASALASLHCTAEEQQRYRIHSRAEVLAFLDAKTHEAFDAVQAYDAAHPSSTHSPELADRRAVVGMIGFPNVGKSSLINVLLGVSATSHGAVRVAVGATPGKTKHLQTVVLSESLLLCDCPGLVFPVFMNTKADLLFNGVLPASNMRDYISTLFLLDAIQAPSDWFASEWRAKSSSASITSSSFDIRSTLPTPCPTLASSSRRSASSEATWPPTTAE